MSGESKRIIVFGATGGLGVPVLSAALDAGHRVTAFARNASKVKLSHERLSVAVGDVLDAEAVASAVEGQDVVISALGPSPGAPAGTLISTGARNIISAMRRHEVKRLVFASGLMVGSCGGMSAPKRLLIQVFRLIHRALYLDKVVAEAVVRESGLAWIIVRPPVLAAVPRRGTYRVGRDLDVRLLDKFAFADVADYMVRATTEDEFIGSAVELSY